MALIRTISIINLYSLTEFHLRYDQLTVFDRNMEQLDLKSIKTLAKRSRRRLIYQQASRLWSIVALAQGNHMPYEGSAMPS